MVDFDLRVEFCIAQELRDVTSGLYEMELEMSPQVCMKKLSRLYNQVCPQYELGNLKWSEVPHVQIFMTLYLGNGNQKEFKACVARRANSRVTQRTF